MENSASALVQVESSSLALEAIRWSRLPQLEREPGRGDTNPESVEVTLETRLRKPLLLDSLEVELLEAGPRGTLWGAPWGTL